MLKKRNIKPAEREIILNFMLSHRQIPHEDKSGYKSYFSQRIQDEHRQLRTQFEGAFKFFQKHPEAVQFVQKMEVLKNYPMNLSGNLIDIADVRRVFVTGVSNPTELIHDLWSPLLDILPDQFLASSDGAQWVKCFQQSTLIIMKNWITEEYLSMIQKKKFDAAAKTSIVHTGDLAGWAGSSNWPVLVTPDDWSSAVKRGQVCLTELIPSFNLQFSPRFFIGCPIRRIDPWKLCSGAHRTRD
jgi:hypothetical protein